MTSVDGVGYTFDNNGNLLATGLLTNTFDAANRLIETTRAGTTLQPSYDGLGNRVAQTVGLSTTYFALDVQGLPEVISTSAGHAYLHLPGVIVAENAAGEGRFLLPDGLGSVRQATDETGAVVAYHEFDPYGNPVANGGEPYGYTGEWWEEEVGLLYLRARWYQPETGSFVSRDPVEGEPAYLYVRGNPINYIDPSGRQCPGCPPEPGAIATPGPQRPTPEPVPVPTPVREGSDVQALSPHRRDDRDLTFWLFNELKKGIENPDVQSIRAIETGLSVPPPHVAPTLLAGIYWRALVRTRARYDFKHQIQVEMFETILFRANDGTELWTEFSVPGNIFFGYVGSYVGFPGWVTHIGAGYAQAVDQVKKIRNICDIPRYLPPSTIWYLGDNPEDYRGVQFGIDLWKKYDANLTLFQFRDELERNRHQFPPAPQLPGSGIIPPYGWINPFGGWPYEVTRFNGPDEDKHWPPRPENGYGFGEF